jgi:hypothetical protein
MKLDRNQFLLLATAIGAATAATGAKSFPEDQSNGTEEQDQTGGACDGDTGQTGRAKYCPIAEGRRKGCLDWSFCDDVSLKAASELRYFDCLASSPVNSCVAEGTATPYIRCGQQVVNHACADPGAATACQRAQRACRGHQGAMMQSCATYLTPMTTAARNQFVSCMVEGCDDYQFKSCTQYLR